MKPKHVMSLQRWFSKPSGLATSRSDDKTLEDLGLKDICPGQTHRKLGRKKTLCLLKNKSKTRLSSDYMVRYCRKACTAVHQATGDIHCRESHRYLAAGAIRYEVQVHQCAVRHIPEGAHG